LTVKNAQDQTRTSELQNHAGALFIKLTNNCSGTLLKYFARMHEHIDEMVKNKMINSIQFSILYEGLILLSNHFENIDFQRKFIIEHLLPRINWITTYDFGPNGINFFRDIGLTQPPNPTATDLPYFLNAKFMDTYFALNLLSR